MKVLGKKKGNKLEFVIEDTDSAFANSLRRVMMTEVPTLAVQWIDVHENNSPLFDEILSQRMGLIPLVFDPKKLNFTEDCKCGGKGCPLCQVVFTIDKKGPGTVVSGDMKSSDKGVAPVDKRIPIVDLLEGQSVKLVAVARLGTGLSHARHHAANASYQYYPEISFKGSATDAKKAARACPKGALSAKGTKLVIKDPAKCDLCRSCMEEVKGVTVKGNESKIIFRTESVSGLEPAYIVTRAAEILEARAEEFKKKLDKV